MSERVDGEDVVLLWDVHLVAALMAAGQEVGGVSWQGSRGYFRLVRSPQLDTPPAP